MTDKTIRHTDYSSKMDDLVFTYDGDFYPLDSELPDPQVDPIIPGVRVALDKVGIGPVDLPIRVPRRNGEIQVLQSEASLYCSLDDPNAKGLNLSRLYIVMDEAIRDTMSLDAIKNALYEMAEKQGSHRAYCKLRFKYPWEQEALRSRAPITSLTPVDSVEKLADGSLINKMKAKGHIAYKTEIEGQYDVETGYRFYLQIEYVYSSTCPCSFELAHDATSKREAAANAHSQRSIATVKVQFDPDQVIWIEDLVELCRKQIPTEVQIYVKRRDEQAFAELNGSNLLFSEDVCRLMYASLDEWYKQGKIQDFSVAVSHEESLHPWNAIAVVTKRIPGGLR